MAEEAKIDLAHNVLEKYGPDYIDTKTELITSRTSDGNSAEIFGFSGFFRVKAVKQPVRTAP
ncbi:hypothetical protein PIB30_098236 [Stylosanthes scabra]|uniref:Uncharacterized protein n=1 Tax=Stylosanthes scabra TaxID=79078 RepID=A0ABU6RWG6_9FABA|nr:hypothetical protein [Stylosanthes scabra]